MSLRIDLFPPEMLIEVFYQLLILNYRPRLPPSVLRSPFLFTQICSSWRKLALSSPQLWTQLTLHLSCEVHRTYRLGPYISMAKLCFSRAGTLPLSLTITSDSASENENLVLPLVLPYVKRLAHLDLQLPFSHLHSFLNLPRGFLDYLENVSITAYHSSHSADAVWGTMSAFKGCPRLRCVTFSGSPPFVSDAWQPSRCINPFDTNLPWTQLTDLNFYGIAVPCHSVLQVLRQCGRLCVLTVTLFSMPTIWREDLVVLSKLTTLSVFVQRWSMDLALFLLNISLPMLKELEITSTGVNATMDATVLLGLQSNSTPFPLSSFSLSNCTFEEHIPAMVEFLHGVPRLQKLTLPISQAVNSTPVLAALTLPGRKAERSSDPPFLPVLRSLSLVGPWHYPSQKEWSRAAKSVARMVKSRYESSHLREFVFASDAEIVSPGRDILRDISRRGVHIQVFLRRLDPSGVPLLIPYDLFGVIQSGHQYSFWGGVLR